MTIKAERKGRATNRTMIYIIESKDGRERYSLATKGSKHSLRFGNSIGEMEVDMSCMNVGVSVSIHTRAGL